MSRRDPDQNCPQCFLPECDCDCATCAAARVRRETLTREEELQLALQAAVSAPSGRR